MAKRNAVVWAMILLLHGALFTTSCSKLDTRALRDVLLRSASFGGQVDEVEVGMNYLVPVGRTGHHLTYFILWADPSWAQVSLLPSSWCPSSFLVAANIRNRRCSSLNSPG